MKMSQEHFAALTVAVRGVLGRCPGAAESDAKANGGVSSMRFRWDVLHASGFSTRSLYVYLNDTHIDTALRAIIDAKGAI